MKGGMSRVDITGQVNVDNPACSNSSPCKIDQHPSSLVQTPTNWNEFCNAVDEVLTPLTTIKRVAKLSSLLLYIVLAIFVLGVQLLPRTMSNFDYSLLKYSSVVFIPIIVAYAVIYCFYIRRGLSATMDKVRDVCERYSCDGVVQYSLNAEHWGGCNKPHVKRYYILVDINEGETTASGDYNSGDAEALNGDDFATTNDNPNLQDDTYSTARFAALLNE